MGDTQIAWCDKTWNVVAGCTKVSPGCDHCWALRNVWRFGHNPNAKMQATYHGLAGYYDHDERLDWTGVVRCLPERLDEPLYWRTPHRVFVVSQADLFHEKVPDEFIAKVFAMMCSNTQHTFMLLTKRPARMLAFWRPWLGSYPLPNVWAGVTCEDQARADERIPLLLQVPAAVRWISVEPMLGPVDLFDYIWTGNAVTRRTRREAGLPGLDWVVAGAESGPGHRPMQESWVRDLRDQCQAAGVPLFYKQAWVDGKLVHLPSLDRQQWTELPGAEYVR